MENKKIIWKVIIIVLIALILLGFSALLIDKSYFRGEGLEEANTHFEPKDILTYTVSGLAFIGTVIFTYVTLEVNKNAVIVSKRMLELEEKKYIPCVDIILLNKAEYDEHKNDNNRIEFYTEINEAASLQSNTHRVGVYNGYNFIIKNITENYIHNIVLETIKIDKINSEGQYLENIVNNAGCPNYIRDSNTYLAQKEEKYMEISSEMFDATSFDYRRYIIKMILVSDIGRYSALIKFDVQNVGEFLFAKNKEISTSKILDAN